jgi:hypothetical protein
MGVKLSFFLALMLLLPHFHCVNWQSTGTLSYEMLNTIWNYINTNFDPTITYAKITSGDITFTNFATGLSTQLNKQFDPAWNVVVAYNADTTANFDTIFYGYGFKDHWLWYNGYKMNDGKYVTFIIWKDYNCQTYISYKGYAQSITNSFASTDRNLLSVALSTGMPKWRWDDPWRAAFSYVDYL